MKQEDITAYHHTSLQNGRAIIANGFDPRCFLKIHLGYGVQCVLQHKGEPLFGGKQLDGEVEVSFPQCKYLDIDDINDKRIIIKSIERIREAEPHKKQVKVAMDEAKKLIALGFDAYTLYYSGNKIIIFLNLPNPIRWLKY